jgi:hypothetical protein
MTAFANTARFDRRARLKLVVSESAETDAIIRILHKRLRERRIAQERRQAHRAKAEKWIDIARALEIQGTDNPADLAAALASGKVQHHFKHPTRWWVSKPVPPRLWRDGTISGKQLIGPNGSDLENEHQVLRINAQDWHEWLGKPADVPPIAAEKVQPRDAIDDEIRVAMREVYDEKGDERPNTNKIVSPVRDRLESKGLYASREKIGDIAGEEEFKKRRNPPGPTKRSRRTK